MSFSGRLQRGQVGESAIARWLRSRGWSLLPVYDIEHHTGKGPRVFGPQGTMVAPDILAFRGDAIMWVEAKHKTAFTWYREKEQWETGIDLCYYEDYCQIEDRFSWPVWLMFLHRGGKAKDSPEESPAGLFGRELRFLRESRSHLSPKMGKGGMIFWSIDQLHLLAPISDLSPKGKL